MASFPRRFLAASTGFLANQDAVFLTNHFHRVAHGIKLQLKKDEQTDSIDIGDRVYSSAAQNNKLGSVEEHSLNSQTDSQLQLEDVQGESKDSTNDKTAARYSDVRSSDDNVRLVELNDSMKKEIEKTLQQIDGVLDLLGVQGLLDPINERWKTKSENADTDPVTVTAKTHSPSGNDAVHIHPPEEAQQDLPRP